MPQDCVAISRRNDRQAGGRTRPRKVVRTMVTIRATRRTYPATQGQEHAAQTADADVLPQRLRTGIRRSSDCARRQALTAKKPKTLDAAILTMNQLRESAHSLRLLRRSD